MAPADSPKFETVCRVGDVPDGTGRMFAAAGTMIGVFHVGDQFFAIENACPHAGASLAHGYVTGDTVACRIHHWRFSLRDGTYLDEDKPSCNVRTYAVRIVGEEVQVAVEPRGWNASDGSSAEAPDNDP